MAPPADRALPAADHGSSGWQELRRQLADTVAAQIAAVDPVQLDHDAHGMLHPLGGALPLITPKAAALIRHLQCCQVGHSRWLPRQRVLSMACSGSKT